MDSDRIEKFPEVDRVGRGGSGGHHPDRGEEPHQVPDRRGRAGGQEGLHRVDEGGGPADEGESEHQQGGPAGQLARPPRRPRPRHLRPEQVLQTAEHSRLTSQVDEADCRQTLNYIRGNYVARERHTFSLNVMMLFWCFNGEIARECISVGRGCFCWLESTMCFRGMGKSQLFPNK